MRTPRRWIDACPQSTESRLMQSLGQEPMPEGALLRAGVRLGVAGAILHGTASAAATTAAGNAVAASTAASAGSAIGATSSTLALTVTLAKALTVGLGIGTLIVGVARGVNPGAPSFPESARAIQQAAAAHSSVNPSSKVNLSVANEAASRLAAIAEAQPTRPRHAAPEATTSATGQAAPEIRAYAIASSRSPALARFSDLPDSASAPQATDRSPVQAMPVPNAPLETAPSRSGLAFEVRSVDRAREALDAGDGRTALSILQQAEYQKFQTLGREAKLLRVEAMLKLGQLAEAEQLARALLRQGVSPAQRQVLEQAIPQK